MSVGVGDGLLQAVAHLHAQLLALGRDQGRRARHRDRDAHLALSL